MNKEIIKRLYLPGTIKKLKRKEDMLGLDASYDIYSFLNKRLLACIIIFLISLVILPYSYICAPIITILYYYFVEYVCFDIPIQKRSKIIDKESLYFFETVLIALENGTSLKKSLEKACLANPGELANEFNKALTEVNLGKDLNKSLKDMQKRIPNNTVQYIILNIINTNKFGNNITESVANQLKNIKDQDFLETRKHLNKIPIYVKLVSFFFVCLTLILIVMLPVLANMLK